MSEKIEFPTGVELPLAGGGLAVLYEFFENRWYGRAKPKNESIRWIEYMWRPDGRDLGECSLYPGHLYQSGSAEMQILPLKRKAWVVWAQGVAWGVLSKKEHAIDLATKVEHDLNMVDTPRIQEITEPGDT